METRISSLEKEVVIGPDRPVVLIGERINPAGREAFKESLKRGDLEPVRREAIAQAEAGADVLDLCVGTFGADEVALLPEAVRAVMDAVDLPLCLDSTNVAALEAALKIYKGKALINSVTAEEKSLREVLPLVKTYHAAVIGLVQDDEGIPSNTARRVEIARVIVDRALQAGISPEDIIIDGLISSVGADTNSGRAVIEAIRNIRATLGVNVTLGASNVSFGLPNRPLLNNVFAIMAVTAGATCLITDVARTRPAIIAADLILGRDKHARRYIRAYRRGEIPEVSR